MNLVSSNSSLIEVPSVLNSKSIASLERQWKEIDFENIHLLLLTGKDSVFCQGMDLQWIAEVKDESLLPLMKKFGNFLHQLHTAPFITMAIVDGIVTGGGVGICSACDLVVCTRESTFRLTEGMFGLVPGVILSALLTRLTKHTIKKMVFTAKNYDTTEALKIGLIDDFVPKEDLERTVLSWLSQLKKCKKQSVIDLKMLLNSVENDSQDLDHKSAQLLNKRLYDTQIKNRLLNLAYFNQK